MAIKFHGSYQADDVQFLLTPVFVADTDLVTKEQRIQRGEKHYSEMLSKEYCPSKPYLAAFHATVTRQKPQLARHILALAHHLNQREHLTLVSLARAGIPVGVLLKRTLREVFQREVPHYAMSIFRDRGLDKNALHFLVAQTPHSGEASVFIDGWTGKGVICRELQKWITEYNRCNNTRISSDLYTLSDPAGTATYTATHEDYLIPSALLNATLHGLISRTVWNRNPTDFHGCRYHSELQANDLTQWYITQLMAEIKKIPDIPTEIAMAEQHQQECSAQCLNRLREKYHVSQPNLLKPGLGEALRVLLRRLPRLILVHDKNSSEIAPLRVLAAEKHIPLIEEIPLTPYKAVSLIAEIR